jgi:hypothetical protein
MDEYLAYLKEMLANVPSSAKKNVNGLLEGFAEAMRQNSGDFNDPFGARERRANQPAPITLVAENMKRRYGGLDAAANTLKADPVGVGLDVASLLYGVKGAGRGAVRQVPTRMAKTIGTMRKADQGIDVLRDTIAAAQQDANMLAAGPWWMSGNLEKEIIDPLSKELAERAIAEAARRAGPNALRGRAAADTAEALVRLPLVERLKSEN